MKNENSSAKGPRSVTESRISQKMYDLSVERNQIDFEIENLKSRLDAHRAVMKAEGMTGVYLDDSNEPVRKAFRIDSVREESYAMYSFSILTVDLTSTDDGGYSMSIRRIKSPVIPTDAICPSREMTPEEFGSMYDEAVKAIFKDRKALPCEGPVGDQNDYTVTVSAETARNAEASGAASEDQLPTVKAPTWWPNYMHPSVFAEIDRSEHPLQQSEVKIGPHTAVCGSRGGGKSFRCGYDAASAEAVEWLKGKLGADAEIVRNLEEHLKNGK